MDILAKKAARAKKVKAYREANKEKIAEQRKAYREATKEKIAEYSKAYREANRKKVAEYNKAYREANQEKISEMKKAYREANQEKISEYNKAYCKAYYEANKEEINEQVKAYREANQEKISEQRRAYRHSDRGIGNNGKKRRRELLAVQSDQTITPEFITNLFQEAKLCPYCGKEMLDGSAKRGDLKTLDHLIPVYKGGLHSQYNVAVCCHSCNSKKRDLTYPEWLDRLKEPHRTIAEKLYIKQYGASPIQGVLPLVFCQARDRA